MALPWGRASPKRKTAKRKTKAKELGVARETVRDWFSLNGQEANRTKSKPDARVKVNEAAKVRTVVTVPLDWYS